LLLAGSNDGIEAAALALAQIAHMGKSQQAQIAAAGALRSLVPSLRNGVLPVRIASCRAIAAICCDSDGLKAKVRKAGAADAIAELLCEKRAQEAVVSLCCTLAHNSPKNQAALIQAGVLPTLAFILSQERSLSAAAAVMNLCTISEAQARTAIVDSGLIQILVALVADNPLSECTPSATAALASILSWDTRHAATAAELGILKPMLAILREPTSTAHESAAAVVAVTIRLSDDLCAMAAEAGAVSSLAELLRCGSIRAKAHAAVSLAALACDQPPHSRKLEVANAGTVGLLVALLETAGIASAAKVAAANAFEAMAFSLFGLKQRVIEEGAIPKVVELLGDSQSEVRYAAASALETLCAKEDRCKDLAASAIGPLVQMLSENDATARAAAASALRQLVTEHPSNREAAAHVGALAPLLAMLGQKDAACFEIAAWTLANLVHGMPALKESLLGSDVVADAVHLLRQDCSIDTKEALVWLLGNLADQHEGAQHAIGDQDPRSDGAVSAF
jgi:hypothetical protein